MTLPARLALLCAAALATLAVAGCGGEKEPHTRGHTEGIYITVDGLKYQVQLSRILNPANVEDAAYMKGLPEGEELAENDVWFGVFMRVENETDEQLPATGEFRIVDTTGAEFEPIELDGESNVFAYQPRPVGPGQLLPGPNSPAADGTIQGALVLFKLTTASLGNRPLEFEIGGGETHGVVDLDV